jgi:3-methyladenine DNA glycosylase AlkC
MLNLHHPTLKTEFVTAWNHHNDGSETVSETALRHILKSVDAPLGLGQYASAQDVDK